MSFIAFLTPDPVGAMHATVRLGKPHLDKLRVAPAPIWIRLFTAGPFFLTRLEQSLADAPPLWIAAEEAVRKVGAARIADVCARPATFLLDRGAEEAEAMRPPIVLHSAGDADFQIGYNGIAWRDKAFARRILSLASLVGMAERLARPTGAGPHRVCQHVRCSHFAASLCNSYYLFPSLRRSHQDCLFPALFETGGS